jgi:hypothetical protein
MALVTKRDVHEAFLSSSSSFFFFFFSHGQNTCLKTPSMFHSCIINEIL